MGSFTIVVEMEHAAKSVTITGPREPKKEKKGFAGSHLGVKDTFRLVAGTGFGGAGGGWGRGCWAGGMMTSCPTRQREGTSVLIARSAIALITRMIHTEKKYAKNDHALSILKKKRPNCMANFDVSSIPPPNIFQGSPVKWKK